MMANSKDFLVRRRNVRRVLQAVSLACTVFGTSVLSREVDAHTPNCNCGKSDSRYGSTGSGFAVDCGTEEGVVSVPVHTRKLSVAEKFLRHLDKVGDKIEANVLPLPQVQCTTCGPGDFGPPIGHEIGCGVEIGEPSCGLENPSRDCGCSTCAGGSRSSATRRSNGSSYRYQEAQEEVYYEEEVYEDSSEYTQSEADQYGSEPSAAPSKPATPRSAPPKAAPATQPPVQLEPVPQPKNVTPEVAPPKLEMPPSDGFTPRRPNSSPAQLDPVPAGPKTALPPVETPTLKLPEVKDPIRIPAPNTPQPPRPQTPKPQIPSPQSPTPLDNLPDILVDPFKDDLSFQHRRNRMNGMNANARNRMSEQPAAISQSTSSRGQANGAANGRVQAASANSRWGEARGNIRSDDQGTVSRASAEQPAVYSQGGQIDHSQDSRGQSQIQRISYEEPLAPRAGQTAPVIHRIEHDRLDHAGQPQVNRIAVPQRR